MQTLHSHHCTLGTRGFFVEGQEQPMSRRGYDGGPCCEGNKDDVERHPRACLQCTFQGQPMMELKSFFGNILPLCSCSAAAACLSPCIYFPLNGAVGDINPFMSCALEIIPFLAN